MIDGSDCKLLSVSVANSGNGSVTDVVATTGHAETAVVATLMIGADVKIRDRFAKRSTLTSGHLIEAIDAMLKT